MSVAHPAAALPAVRTGVRREGAVLAALALLLAVAVVAAVGVGAVPIAPGETLAILFDRVGVRLPWTWQPHQEAVLVSIRLPRVLLAVLVGAGLAASGAAMQGLFRNPLADPGLVGVSSGAALAAVTALVLGGGVLAGAAAPLAPWLVPLAAFGGALGTTLLVHRLAGGSGRPAVATLLLAGIAFNALAGAGTGMLIFVANDAQLRDITFWTLGGLGGATWPVVGVLLLPLAGTALLARGLARPLNALLLGPEEAGHLGVDVVRTRRRVVLLAALAVGAGTAVAGMIGFVGLVVPHLLRLAVGPDHRLLLPGSALLGGTLLLAADLAARTAIAPAELPVGIVTALLGAPFFLWLLLRAPERSGWSAP